MLDTLKPFVINKAKAVLGYQSWNSDVDQAQLIRNPQVIFDIGANVGQSSATYRKMYPDAEIWAFEPVPETFSQLASRFKGDNRVHQIPLALGDLQGTATLNRGPKSITDSMLLRENRTGETITIQTDTVDNFCAANSISNIDILRSMSKEWRLECLPGLPRCSASERFERFLPRYFFPRHIRTCRCFGTCTRC